MRQNAKSANRYGQGWLGAFNLVRAAAYGQCGGYESLRLTVVDDLKLGLLLCRAGKRTRGFLGGDDVECHCLSKDNMGWSGWERLGNLTPNENK